MLFNSQRHSVRGSLYGDIIPILESTGWTYEQYLDQPDDLIIEMEARMRGKSG